MRGSRQSIGECRKRVANGNAAAALEFRINFGPAMECIVRRAMRRGQSASPVERRILENAECLLQTDPAGSDSNELSRTVSLRLIEGLLDSQPSAPSERPSQRLLETVT